MRQTYSNLEIIVINDGSIDRTDEIICEKISGDSRFTYIARENRGLVATLNQMISMCQGIFIARMDADDISAPLRIEKQVAFFMKNPSFAVLGSRTQLIDEQGKTLGFCRRPLTSPDVAAYFLYGSPLAHPSVMFNTRAVPKADLVYSAGAYPVEDLELWLRLNKNYLIANLKNALLRYRLTPSGISQSNRQRQRDASARIRAEFLGHERSVAVLLKAIDHDRGSILAKAMLRLWSTLNVIFSSNQFSTLSLLKVWLKTVVRDVRRVGFNEK
jgi:glycosyltransferase involved in cell wall biosynthesis